MNPSYKSAMSAPIKRGEECPYCKTADEKHGAPTCPGCLDRHFERDPVVIQTDTSLLARGARLWDSWWGAVVGGRSW
jgi:hypothetical protein